MCGGGWTFTASAKAPHPLQAATVVLKEPQVQCMLHAAALDFRPGLSTAAAAPRAQEADMEFQTV